jgi:hypothetical protein
MERLTNRQGAIINTNIMYQGTPEDLEKFVAPFRALSPLRENNLQLLVWVFSCSTATREHAWRLVEKGSAYICSLLA